jgi:hypothetical protein
VIAQHHQLKLWRELCWRRLKTDHFEGFVPIEF